MTVINNAFVTCAGFFVAITNASYAGVIYNVSISDGASTTLTGTISTDGVFGSLAQADIVAVDLTFSTNGLPNPSYTLNGPVLLTGANGSIFDFLAGINATSTNLSMQTNTPNSYLVFTLPNLQNQLGFFSNVNNNPNPYVGLSQVSVPNPPYYVSAYSNQLPTDGNTWIFATAAPTAVPEPSTFALLTFGSGGLAFGACRRRRVAV